MSLYDAKNDCLIAAKPLGDYTKYSINELADGYCKACDEQDEYGRSMYSAALILRFWYTIDKTYQKCKTSGIDRDDLFANLYECIDNACKYRAWQDPNKKTNAQACINQSIATRGAAAIMYRSNLQKNKVAFNMISLDAPISSSDPEGDTWADQLEDETQNVSEAAGLCYDIVCGLLKDNKYVEAIVLDTIAHHDCFKYHKQTVKGVDEDGEEYKYTKTTSEFWPFRVVQHLNELQPEYVEYFTKEYYAPAAQVKAAFDALVKANNTKKYKIIDSSLASAKTIVA